MNQPRAITIAILAMGGEGGGVLADWIVELAETSGFRAQTTSVPGVAQRTGSTIYYVELFPETPGPDPVLALMPVPGEVDIVIASELMEAGRAVQRGLVTPDRTTLIASSHRVYSMTEKTAPADGRVDETKLIGACVSAARKFLRADFAEIAADQRSVISAALFGALAAADALPFARGQFEQAIRQAGVGVENSLAAFAAGFAAVHQPAVQQPDAQVAGDAALPTPGPRLRWLHERVKNEFPQSSHIVLLHGVLRLADYQDERYAAEFLDRLRPICTLDRDGGLLIETARHLALWMSYEDTIRVADLKTRSARFLRVRKEARADSRQVVHIREFLHPRVEEIADTLPAGPGRWLLNTGWARGAIERLTRKGKVVETSSLGGFLLLYSLAGLRRFRRRSLRFGIEQQHIDAWLERVAAAAGVNSDFALELAQCPRLVKGYGDTHRRGWQAFEQIMSVSAGFADAPDASIRLKRLRETAMSEVAG